MKKYLKAVFAVVLAVALLLPLAACGNKTEKIKIAVPNDTTNEARALLLLEDQGFIKLLRNRPKNSGITGFLQKNADFGLSAPAIFLCQILPRGFV